MQGHKLYLHRRKKSIQLHSPRPSQKLVQYILLICFSTIHVEEAVSLSSFQQLRRGLFTELPEDKPAQDIFFSTIVSENEYNFTIKAAL